MKPEMLIKALSETDEYIKYIYLNGGCYKFYKFLKSVFPEAEPYFNVDEDHVVSKIGRCYYDITGEVEGEYLPLSKQDIEKCERWSFSRYNWLYKECPACGEPVNA